MKYIKNTTANQLIITDLSEGQLQLEASEVYNITEREEEFIASSNCIALVQNGSLQVGISDSSFYTDALEGLCYLKSRFDNIGFIVDGTNLIEYQPVIQTDTSTGKKGVSLFLNMLSIQKELYNSADNPLYVEGFQKFIGEGGRELEHIARTANLEDIHQATGWHQREIWNLGIKRPHDLLFYYGWLNSYNYDKNSWTNELVAQDLAKYEMIVLGNGIADPTHGDYANTAIIIPRVQALNPFCKIFGYVTTNQTLENFQTHVDQWEDLKVNGIFMDESGYDYGTVATNGRDAFNTKVDYVHGQTYAKLCFVNAWYMDHIIGTTNDASYPNSTWNADVVASNLSSGDWYLLESCPINTTSYTGTGGYESKSDWAARCNKALTHRDTYGINLASCGIINNDNTNGQKLFEFGYISSIMFAHDAYGTSDTAYGSSSALVAHWNRPNLSNLGRIWTTSPGVLVDGADADIYWRFLDHGKLKLDFSSSAELSDIVRFDFQMTSRIVYTTTSYTVLDTDEVVICDGTSLTITLPTYVGRKNKRFIIKNINSSALTLQGSSSQNIDSSNTKTVNQWEKVEVIGYDNAWLTI